MSEVRVKVLAALKHLRDVNEVPSVSKVCRLAEVSRANLYATYPDLVEEINQKINMSLPKATKSTAEQNRSRGTETSKLRQELKVLAYACLELRNALDREREKTEFLKAQLKRATERKQ